MTASPALKMIHGTKHDQVITGHPASLAAGILADSSQSRGAVAVKLSWWRDEGWRSAAATTTAQKSEWLHTPLAGTPNRWSYARLRARAPRYSSLPAPAAPPVTTPPPRLHLKAPLSRRVATLALPALAAGSSGGQGRRTAAVRRPEPPRPPARPPRELVSLAATAQGQQGSDRPSYQLLL